MQTTVVKNNVDKETVSRMKYASFVIPEFAEAFKMDKPEGYRYLKKYGGLEYVLENWWALHTDNQYHVMLEIFDYCKKNGGYL